MEYVDSFKECPKVSGTYEILTLDGKHGYSYFDTRYGGAWLDGDYPYSVIKYWRSLSSENNT